jgi:hypothetical protein
MEIVAVKDILSSVGLVAPSLRATIPNKDNYKITLFQPKGVVEVSENGVRNKDRKLANDQFSKYLSYAYEASLDIAVTPEYSTPWEVLKSLVQAGQVPKNGKIWILGCESITKAGLKKFTEELEDEVHVLYENIQESAQRFYSPLAYVFRAPVIEDKSKFKTVILVQFKTHSLSDPSHFEINNMAEGSQIYQFGGENGNEIRLVTLICADAFSFKDHHADQIHHNGLIFHIQLNQNPRHNIFTGCRSKLLGYGNDTTEIVCLNWARDVCIWTGDIENTWGNIGGSAWYTKSNDLDTNDLAISENHAQGFYYTWLKELKTHTIFFNYDPAVFTLIATKVAHIAVPGPISRRKGPKLNELRTWDEVKQDWVINHSLDDGFCDLALEAGNAESNLRGIVQTNPMALERVVAVAVGAFSSNRDWFSAKNLDSVRIDKCEIVNRLAFCQDTESHSIRKPRLRKVSRLWELLSDANFVPTSMSDFPNGFGFSCNRISPIQNVVSDSGVKATAIYLGEDVSESEVDATYTKASENIHMSFKNFDESDSARQRLAVWYRDTSGEIVMHKEDYGITIDRDTKDSAVDFGRVE